MTIRSHGDGSAKRGGATQRQPLEITSAELTTRYDRGQLILALLAPPPMTRVVLLDPSPAWPHHFQSAAAELHPLFPAPTFHLEHIGSTSVPDLPAKPILDLLLGAPDLASIEAKIPRLTALGYRYKPEHEREIPERRYFSRPAAADAPAIHLHAVVHGAALWRDHLAFRDALRSDPALTRAYAELKRDLAALYAGDRAAYSDAKGPFITEVLARLHATHPPT